MNNRRLVEKGGCWFLIAVMLICATGMSATPVSAATIIVNSLADTNDGACNSSHCTLREAMNAANASLGADTINFNLSGKIALSDYLPAVLSAGGGLTIDPLTRSITIDGQGAHRIFDVRSSGKLHLKSLTLEDGHTTVVGGGIYSVGELTLEAVTMIRCNAEDSGGAIFSEGTLTVTASSFYSNTTDIADGGAIYINSGQADIRDSHFEANVAGYAGGAIYNHDHDTLYGGDLTIQDSTFTKNRSFGGYGGAIANQSDLEVTGGTFTLNSAQNGGGAFYNQFGGSYIILDSGFAFNNAVLGNGGAIYIQNASSHGSARIEDSAILLNVAHNNGAGFYVVAGEGVIFRRTRIAYNVASDSGGAGYNLIGQVYLLDDAIEDNDAGQDGGGMYNNGDVYINRTTFSGNSADGAGGGVYHSVDAELSLIENTTFYANSASQGGGIYSRGDLLVINCTLSTNSADTAAGGGVNANISTTFYNSIVTNHPSGGNCNPAHPMNWGNNLDSGATCGFGTLHDSHSSTNPLLGALKDNGGWTRTMMPGAGSLAIDGVTYDPPNRGPEDDQRGYARPYGSFNDIGAVEAYTRIYLPLIRR
jgi:CSLREA domain-containing protein